MYCSSCGAALAEGLNFCNRCGAKLKVSAESLEVKSPHVKLAEVAQYVSVATAGVAFGGLFLVVRLVKELLSRGVVTNVIVILAVLSLLVIFGISGLLIRQLSRVLNIYLQSGDAGKLKDLLTSGERQAARLESSRESAPSVTEPTTRILEPTYRERNTQR